MLRDGFLRFCNDPEIACCKAEREFKQLRVEAANQQALCLRLQAQLASTLTRAEAAEAERDAAVAFIHYLDYNYSGYMCEDGRFKEWRGPQAGKGAEHD